MLLMITAITTTTTTLTMTIFIEQYVQIHIKLLQMMVNDFVFQRTQLHAFMYIEKKRVPYQHVLSNTLATFNTSYNASIKVLGVAIVLLKWCL